MHLGVQLLIDGSWGPARDGRTLPIVNPATESVIGLVAHAGLTDLEYAAAAVKKGFDAWKVISAFERAKVMRRAAALLRERANQIAELLTAEQGKPLAEAKAELATGADIIEWFAEEARRTYGRLTPPRAPGIVQMTICEPVGPVAAFTPWSFPVNQAVRKISIALAAGCSILVKGPEETPASCAELVRAFVDAGLPNGAINLVFGNPAEISSFLIPHPVIRKISFTGSTAVGKELAALAGLHMKRATMELGGHAPVLVFDDADIDLAVKLLAAAKFRNAGQVCASPTRFLIQDRVHDEFVDKFVAASREVKVGSGLEDGVTMGPLANARRITALEEMVQDAVAKGAKLEAGGKRIGNIGFFFEPTVLSNVPVTARAMNEEPFGPVALVRSFSETDEAIAEANRLPFGLASYAYTSSGRTAARVGEAVEAGMMTINHSGLALPEVPFGGIKDSGHGTEGGPGAITAYIIEKFITHAM